MRTYGYAPCREHGNKFLMDRKWEHIYNQQSKKKTSEEKVQSGEPCCKFIYFS